MECLTQSECPYSRAHARYTRIHDATFHNLTSGLYLTYTIYLPWPAESRCAFWNRARHRAPGPRLNIFFIEYQMPIGINILKIILEKFSILRIIEPYHGDAGAPLDLRILRGSYGGAYGGSSRRGSRTQC